MTKWYVLHDGRWHKARRNWDGRIIYMNISYPTDSTLVKAK